MCICFIHAYFWIDLTSLFLREPLTPTQQTLQKTASLKRESIKDSSNHMQMINLKKDLEKEQKKSKELKHSLEEKIKAMSKVQMTLDSLENEKVLFDTEKKV